MQGREMSNNNKPYFQFLYSLYNKLGKQDCKILHLNNLHEVTYIGFYWIELQI